MSGWPASDSLWMFARRYQEERCQKRLAAASASPCVASRPSFVACHGRRGGVLRVVGLEVGAVEGLGDRPDRLGAEAQRLALVGRQPVRVPGAGVQRQDRDVLAELAEAGDEPAARERDVVRVGGNEDMGHGQRSIAGHDRRRIPRRRRSARPSPPRRSAARRRTARPSAPSTRSPWRSTTSSCCSRRDAHRDHQPPPVAQLVAQRLGDRRAPPPRRRSRPTARRPAGPGSRRRRARSRGRRSPGAARRSRARPRPGAARARSTSRGSPAPRGPRPGSRSPCRRPARGRRGPTREQLGHARDDVRLADRLAARRSAAGGPRRRASRSRSAHEGLARDGGHRGEDARVRMSRRAELVGDHPGPGVARACPGLVHRRRRQLAAGLGGRRRGRRGLAGRRDAAAGDGGGDARGGATRRAARRRRRSRRRRATRTAAAGRCGRRRDRDDRGRGRLRRRQQRRVHEPVVPEEQRVQRGSTANTPTTPMTNDGRGAVVDVDRLARRRSEPRPAARPACPWPSCRRPRRPWPPRCRRLRPRRRRRLRQRRRPRRAPSARRLVRSSGSSASARLRLGVGSGSGSARLGSASARGSGVDGVRRGGGVGRGLGIRRALGAGGLRVALLVGHPGDRSPLRGRAWQASPHAAVSVPSRRALRAGPAVRRPARPARTGPPARRTIEIRPATTITGPGPNDADRARRPPPSPGSSRRTPARTGSSRRDPSARAACAPGTASGWG